MPPLHPWLYSPRSTLLFGDFSNHRQTVIIRIEKVNVCLEKCTKIKYIAFPLNHIFIWFFHIFQLFNKHKLRNNDLKTNMLLWPLIRKATEIPGCGWAGCSQSAWSAWASAERNKETVTITSSWDTGAAVLLLGVTFTKHWLALSSSRVRTSLTSEDTLLCPSYQGAWGWSWQLFKMSPPF